MRYALIVIVAVLLVMSLTGCFFTMDYQTEYAHLPKYKLKNSQIKIGDDTYILSDWNYPGRYWPMDDPEAEAIARVDDRDSQMRSLGVIFTIGQYSDRSFLYYAYEVDAYSGWGGCLILRRSDIEMPELTYENVDSLESEHFGSTTRDETVIYEFFAALNDETRILDDPDVWKADEYYDSIICRNDDWPDFCFRITVTCYEDQYFAFSDYLGEDGAWITMPQALIEKIAFENESA